MADCFDRLGLIDKNASLSQFNNPKQTENTI